jgi:outer membrane protein with beta-barrel domain
VSRRLIVCAAALAAAAAAGTPASAQVGHTPATSPFRDLLYRMEATIYTGYYHAPTDPAGVLPTSGPMAGVRWDARLGGPAYFTFNLGATLTSRTVLDPKAPAATRSLGEEFWPIYSADAGLSLNLTGFKSYRHIVPVVNVGLGIATDLHTDADVGEFKFGTPFAFSYGAGLKYVRDGRTALRFDITDRIYEINYPNSYFQASSSGQAPILRTTTPKNLWSHNIGIALGVSYLFFR